MRADNETAMTEAGATQRLVPRLAVVAVALLLAAMSALSLFTLRLFEQRLEPEIQKKVTAVAKTVAADFALAARYGIPAEQLRGVADYLDAAIGAHPEIQYAAFTAPDGTLLFTSRLLQAATPTAAKDAPVALSAAELAALRNHLGQVPHAAESHEIGRFIALELPVDTPAGHLYGTLHLGVDASFVRKKLGEILADGLITLFVSVLITLEVLLLLMALTVTRSMTLLGRLLHFGRRGEFNHYAAWRSRDELGRLIATVNRTIQHLNERYRRLANCSQEDKAAYATDTTQQTVLNSLRQRFRFDCAGPTAIRETSANDIRLALFVYMFGIELSRSFFPLFVRGLYQPEQLPWLSESVVIALPMSLWVVVMIITTPLGTWLSRYLSIRKLLLLGMALSGTGLALTGLAQNIYDLLAWRCLTAAGFGLVTMVALLYIAETVPRERRARGMGVFVGATVAASVCGTSIGGILADYLGFEPTFFAAAGLIALAAALVLRLLEVTERGSAERSKKPNRVSLGIIFTILFGSRGSPLIVLAAIPARLMLTGFLFYLTPLYLTALGYDPAAIGRILMCYFLVMLVLSPLVSTVCDRWGHHRLLLTGGVFSFGAGALLLAYASHIWALVAGITIVGIGQALLTTPQMALIPTVFAGESERYGLGSVLAVFRIAERIGSIGGPLACAALIQAIGFAATAEWVGVSMLAFAVLLALYLTLQRAVGSTAAAPR